MVTGHAGLEAGGDGVDGARLGPERPHDLRHRGEEALFVCLFFQTIHGEKGEKKRVRSEGGIR